MEPFFRQYRAFVGSGDDEGNFFNHIKTGDLSPHEFVDVFLTSQTALRSLEENELSGTTRSRASRRTARIMQLSLVLCTLGIAIVVAMGTMKWKSNRRGNNEDTNVVQATGNGTDLQLDWNGEDSPFAPESELDSETEAPGDTSVAENGAPPENQDDVQGDGSGETDEGDSPPTGTENDPEPDEKAVEPPEENEADEGIEPSNDEKAPDSPEDTDTITELEDLSNTGADTTVGSEQSEDSSDDASKTETEMVDESELADSANDTITETKEETSDTTETYEWSQSSPNIDGTVPKSFLGSSVALSRDGARMVVTAEQYSPTMENDEDNGDEDDKARTYPGLVQAYDRSEDGSWNRVGGDIIGMLKREYRGYTVDISGDGTRIVTGSSLIYLGTAKVYELVGGEWFPLGESIENLFTDTRVIDGGQVVAISDDGSTVAVGADVANTPIRIFKYDNYDNRWVQKGEDIVVGLEAEQKYRAICLSSEGHHVAISTVPKDGSESTNGRVDVYKYHFHQKVEKMIWKKTGKVVAEDDQQRNFGFSLSLSGDANRLAVSSPSSSEGEAGKVFVYEFEGNNLEWTLLGKMVGGGNVGELFGTSISMSFEGRRLAVGAFYHDSTGLKEGTDGSTSPTPEDSNSAGDALVYIYELRTDEGLAVPIALQQGDTPNLKGSVEGSSDEETSNPNKSWVEIGRVGAAEDDDVQTSVFSLSISGDGERLALGAPKTDAVSTLEGEDGNEVRGSLPEVGQVRIYDYHELEA